MPSPLDGVGLLDRPMLIACGRFILVYVLTYYLCIVYHEKSICKYERAVGLLTSIVKIAGSIAFIFTYWAIFPLMLSST